MKKEVLLLVAIVISVSCISQTLQSPEQFLGYKIGTHFTPHYKIVNYVQAVAKARPDMVKVEKYGETYEGRDLILAYISSPQNISNLEVIRQNNLGLTGLVKASATANALTPIVWLSYNVHGNETSSSEAAMQTLFALVDPANTQTKTWLNNTVVIIDPCLNPDGRDRYVNWFNTVVSNHANANASSREHSEPWPGGRTNHYNFDLNRDWAWQTQLETKQRVIKYQQWLPQVHVDFHEQGYNEPYYFAPAAEPFHEVITPWQREFQNIIGRNNAAYFDKEGWLYFTKERFDLFYPSYGDTYPLYNGAIGMTFEQGGGSRGGLAVKTANDDTLTLEDRIMHHYTTGLSTIEASSKNAARLISEFKKYYDDSRIGRGNPNKAYILSSDNADKINMLAEVLKRNNIEFGTTSAAGIKGYNYRTAKDETVGYKKYNLAISTAQPHGVMARVLLEPSSNLNDSITYDITAWSLAFAYGVDAYAVKENVSIKPYPENLATQNITTSAYAYLIKYKSINSVKILAGLLQNGVKIRYSEKPFTYKGKDYDRGTLIVPVKNNPADIHNILNKLSAETEVEIDAIESGFMEKGPDFGSSDIRFLHAPKVALVTGEQTSSQAAGEIWYLFEQRINYPVTLINATDLSRINLKDFTVLILPDGQYKSLSDKTFSDKLKDFVSQGGKIIAMENAVQQLASADWGIKLRDDKPGEKTADYTDLKKYENRERDALSGSIPGTIYRVQLDNTHPLGFGYPDYYYSLKLDDTVYDFLKDGWNVGVIKKDNYVAGFAGSKIKLKLKDSVIFCVQDIGRGSIVYFTDDPLFRQFWENGNLLFCNAVFMVGQ